ncbi:vacuolar fusion protein CCZ1 [Brevipalpus obovatus]|uniref:vacuolar fusion protein CCZ1 n=1 Tax=Brevipalpus obovatus TaxID=246614 RepID=UPI003D9F00AF
MSIQGVPFPAKLHKLLLFNSIWTQKEGEEVNKLIYYSSSGFKSDDDTSWEFNDGDENGLLNCDPKELKDAVNAMGLCEAMINFVKNFGKKEEVYSVHGTKVRLSLKEVEPNFWLGINLILPRTPMTGVTSKLETDKDSYYHDADLNDHLVQLVLTEIYQTFYLFHGCLQTIWDKSEHNLSSLRDVCSRFFHWYLPSLQLSTVNLGELLNSMQYLSLDEETQNLSQEFVKQVLDCDKSCKHVLFLFNARMIHSTLDLSNTRIIYRYLVSTIIPEVASEELSECVRSRASKKTRFIRKGLKIYLTGGNDQYIMNVYRSINGTTLVILFESAASDELDEILFNCDRLMSQRMSEMATKFSELYVQELSLDTTLPPNPTRHELVQGELFRYALCDAGESSFKTNVGFNGILDQRKQSDYELAKPIVDLESDLRTHLISPDPDSQIEIVAKTTNESWLVVNKEGPKTIFSSLNHKNDNLVDAADAVSHHVSRRFKNLLPKT